MPRQTIDEKYFLFTWADRGAVAISSPLNGGATRVSSPSSGFYVNKKAYASIEIAVFLAYNMYKAENGLSIGLKREGHGRDFSANRN